MYVLMMDTHTPMFNGSLTDLDVNKMDLLFWLSYYNRNFFSKSENERPTYFILNYDILFDDWLERQEYKNKLKSANPDRKFAEDMNEVIEFD